MTFFALNTKFRIWVYRIGLIVSCINLFGLILAGINAKLQYGEDIWKRNKNPKFNGRIEKFFYLYGWFFIFLLIIWFIMLIYDFIGR